jgi:hypothetical protein
LRQGAGPDGIVINSRRRVLEYLRSGDADTAALEMEKHLRILRVMWRLSGPEAQRASA